MGSLTEIGLQFVGLLVTLVIVFIVNTQFRFRRSQVVEGTPSRLAAKRELSSWQARQWMAPSTRNLSLAIIAALLLSFLFISTAAIIQLPRRLPALHPNSPLEAVKKQSRDECHRHWSENNAFKAQEALLKNPNVFQVRDKLKADHEKLHSARATLKHSLAIHFEKVLKHIGPMASVLPCFIFLFYRYITKLPASGSQQADRKRGGGEQGSESERTGVLATSHDSTWWTMTEELSTLLITMVGAVSIASFLLFHLWVDEARVSRCVHTSGHWYTWAVTCSCFILVCCVLAVVAFTKPELRKLTGLSSVESEAISMGLNIVGSSVARSLFYGFMVWFGLYQALALNSLTDSQRIYHDAFEAIDGIHTSRYELVIAAILSACAIFVYVTSRDSQIDDAFKQLQAIALLGETEAQDEEESGSQTQAKQVNREAVKQVSKAADTINERAPAPAQRRPTTAHTKPATPPTKLVQEEEEEGEEEDQEQEESTEGTRKEGEEDEQTVPQAPPAPPMAPPMDVPSAPPAAPGPPSSFAPSANKSRSIADQLAGVHLKKAPSSSPPAASSSSREGDKRPSVADLLGGIANLKKVDTKTSTPLSLNSGMPDAMRGNMMLDLQYKGLQRQVAMSGTGGEMKKKVLEMAKTEDKLMKMCAEHRLNYIFPDLALLALSAHYLQENEGPANNMTCPCNKQEEKWD